MVKWPLTNHHGLCVCSFAQAELSKALLSSKLEQAIRASSAVSEEPMVLERCGQISKPISSLPSSFVPHPFFFLGMVALVISPFRHFAISAFRGGVTNEQG